MKNMLPSNNTFFLKHSVASSIAKQGQNCHIIYDILFVLLTIMFIMWLNYIILKRKLVNIDSVVVAFLWPLLFTYLFPMYLFWSPPQTPKQIKRNKSSIDGVTVRDVKVYGIE